MNKQSQAIKLAQHYFRILAAASGIHWDNDNEAEIEQLVRLIVEAARENANGEN